MPQSGTLFLKKSWLRGSGGSLRFGKKIEAICLSVCIEKRKDIVEMKVIFPKNAPRTLVKRVDKALEKIANGTASFRKSQRNGYRTLPLGKYERAVLVEDAIHVFNKHSDYEKFINIAR